MSISLLITVASVIISLGGSELFGHNGPTKIGEDPFLFFFSSLFSNKKAY